MLILTWIVVETPTLLSSFISFTKSSLKLKDKEPVHFLCLLFALFNEWASPICLQISQSHKL